MVRPGKGKGPSFFARYAPPGYQPPTIDEEEDPEEENEEMETESESDSTYRELGSLPPPHPYEPTPIFHSGHTASSGTYG